MENMERIHTICIFLGVSFDIALEFLKFSRGTHSS